MLRLLQMSNMCLLMGNLFIKNELNKIQGLNSQCSRKYIQQITLHVCIQYTDYHFSQFVKSCYGHSAWIRSVPNFPGCVEESAVP